MTRLLTRSARPRTPLAGIAGPALGAVLAWSLAGCAAPPPSEPEAAAPGLGVAPLVAGAGAAAGRGDYDTAIPLYRQALDQTPWNTRLLRRLAVAHAERAGQLRALPGETGLRGAARDLRRALELDPSDATFRRNLSVVLLELAPFARGGEAEELRSEARALDPDVAARAASPDGQPLQHEVERRLDLAFELIDRGQYEVGLRRLESLHGDYPGRGDVTRLLAQGYVLWGTGLAEAADREGAGRAFERAVELYGGMSPCDGARCSPQELRTAHHNLIVVLIESDRRADARRALDSAARAGLEFPGLRTEVAGGP